MGNIGRRQWKEEEEMQGPLHPISFPLASSAIVWSQPPASVQLKSASHPIGPNPSSS